MEIKTQALFCDDVRQSTDGTFIIIGVHPGVVWIKAGQAPKEIGNFIQLTEIPIGIYKCRFVITFEPDGDDKKIVLGDQESTIEVDSEMSVILAPMGLELDADVDGWVRLRMTLGDDAERELCAIRVLYVPESAADNELS